MRGVGQTGHQSVGNAPERTHGASAALGFTHKSIGREPAPPLDIRGRISSSPHLKMGAKSKYSENFSASRVAEEMSSFRSGLQCQRTARGRAGRRRRVGGAAHWCRRAAPGGGRAAWRAPWSGWCLQALHEAPLCCPPTHLKRAMSLTRPNSTSVCSVRSWASSTIMQLRQGGWAGGRGQGEMCGDGRGGDLEAGGQPWRSGVCAANMGKRQHVQHTPPHPRCTAVLPAVPPPSPVPRQVWLPQELAQQHAVSHVLDHSLVCRQAATEGRGTGGRA